MVGVLVVCFCVVGVCVVGGWLCVFMSWLYILVLCFFFDGSAAAEVYTVFFLVVLRIYLGGRCARVLVGGSIWVGGV